jgi:PAS domain S-box-containing protein
MFQIWGFDPSQGFPPGDQMMARVHPDDRSRVEEAAKQLFDHGRNFDLKFRYAHPDGKLRIIRDVCVPIIVDGIIQRFVGACMDITEEEERISQLRLSEAFMAQAQQLARVGSWACKDITSCQHWSEEMFRIFGFDPTKGHPPNELLFSLVHPQDRQHLEECLTQFFKGGQVLDVKYRFIRPDGQLRIIHNFATQVFEGGDNIRFVGACVDITEQETLTKDLRQSETFLQEVQRVARVGSWAWSPPNNLEIFRSQISDYPTQW